MPAPSKADIDRFVALGRSQQIADPDLANAWYYVIEAFENRWFGQEHLDQIIDELKRGIGRGAQEIDVDFDPPGSDHLVVRFISDEYRTSAKALIRELEKLRRRYRGEPEPTAPPSTGGSSADVERFLAVAQSMKIERPEMVPVWPYLLQAIECNWLGPANIDHAIETTRRRIGFGVEELVFDFDPPGADPLIVSFVSDEFRVPADAMVAELERLRERYAGGDDPGPRSGPAATPSTGQSGTTPRGGSAATSAGDFGPSDSPNLVGFLQGLVGNPTLVPAGNALEARMKDVGAAIARIVSTMQSSDPAARERAAAEAAALQRALAEAGANTARWTQVQRDEVARALDAAGGLDLDRLTRGLRTIATWLEQRTPEAGAAIDKLVERLEQTFGRFLTPGKKAAEAQREEKIRADARASIAQRLREAGSSRPASRNRPRTVPRNQIRAIAVQATVAERESQRRMFIRIMSPWHPPTTATRPTVTLRPAPTIP